MLTEDITIEELVAVRSKEAWEDGREEGLSKGREEGREEGYTEVFELLSQGLSVKEVKQHLLPQK